jgi:hypothetical protein
MIVHAGQPLDHQSHSRKRPKIGVESVRPRTLAECLLHLPELGGVEFWLPARTAGAVQSPHAAALPFGIPTAHTLAADLQLAGDGSEDQFAGGE